MPVRTTIHGSEDTLFITFTCYKWFQLIELTNSYDLVYKWFDYLKSKGHLVTGYVIMPNHIHALIFFSKTEKPINKIIGDGKRFMAYEIVKRLKEQGKEDILLRHFCLLVFEPNNKYFFSDRGSKGNAAWMGCLYVR